MKAKLAALLALVFTVGGVAYYSVPSPGTSMADLADAGIAEDCNPVRIGCRFELPDGGDGEKELIIANCPSKDGGLPTRILPRWFARAAEDYGVNDLDFQCVRLGAAANFQVNGAPVDRAGSCACRQPDAGACNYTGPGPNPGLGRNEYPPGSWSGAGCRPKPCGQTAGRDNWPTECPR